MHVHAFDAVLFLHIAVAIFTFGIAGLMLTGLWQMSKAEDLAVLRSWERITHRVEPWFPILVLALIALGSWLIALSHKQFSFSDGWVDGAITGLVLMEAYGGIVLAPAGKRLHALVADEPEGPVSAQVRAGVTNPLVWAGAYGNTGVALGILFTMPTKPAGPWAIVIDAACGLIGIGLGLRLSGARVRVRDTAKASAAA